MIRYFSIADLFILLVGIASVFLLVELVDLWKAVFILLPICYWALITSLFTLNILVKNGFKVGEPWIILWLRNLVPVAMGFIFGFGGLYLLNNIGLQCLPEMYALGFGLGVFFSLPWVAVRWALPLTIVVMMSLQIGYFGFSQDNLMGTEYVVSIPAICIVIFPIFSRLKMRNEYPE